MATTAGLIEECVMTQEINLEDYGGDFSVFLEACYQAYADFWNSNPTFESKKLQRNASNLKNGKEVNFWGMVDGHDDSKQEVSLERYSKVPLLNYIINEQVISQNNDVVYIKRLYQRKVRIEVFSRSKKYLVVLQEIGQTDKVQFITAYPLGTNQIKKKLKQYKEYCDGGKEPL